MLAKRHRLVRPIPFTKGKTLSSPLLSLRYIREENAVKVQIIVSKQVSKKSVVRNRIKRVIATTIREELPKIKTGIYMSIYIRQKAVDVSAKELILSLKELMQKGDITQK